MDKTQVLAERRLRMERDGIEGAQEVSLQIGIPQWSKGSDEAVCAIAIEGLHEELPPARGRDFFEALVQAARTLRQHCRNPTEGAQFFYFDEPPDDRDALPGRATLCRGESRRSEAWEDRHREDWEVLVERKILMQEDGSDERREVVLQIGQPYWMTDGETAACDEGAGEDDIDHSYGRDLFEALSKAVGSINERFAGPQCGRFFFWPDGEPYGGDYPDDPPRRYKRDPRGISGNWQVLAERTC